MLTRRAVLSGLFGCGVTLTMPQLVLARAATENRLVVLVLRGAMDGLEAVQPYGDPAFKALRGEHVRTPGNGLIDLDGRFGLREEMAPLAELFGRGELSVVHAISTPYRSRSHFEGQDMLESGGDLAPRRDGWLNRLLAELPDASQMALDLSPRPSLLLSGPQPVQNWRVNLDLTVPEEQTYWLRQLYESDPLFIQALEEAVAADMHDEVSSGGNDGKAITATAELAATSLTREARIAVFAIPGWDTHVAQNSKIGRALDNLTWAITTLRGRLGTVWDRTAVVAISEFGRTARYNGASGTDHGTGSAMILAGGALKGGRGGRVLYTQWPGLGEGELFEDRDLKPTDDLRRYLGWLLRDLYGVSPTAIADSIFPSVDLGQDLRLTG